METVTGPSPRAVYRWKSKGVPRSRVREVRVAIVQWAASVSVFPWGQQLPGSQPYFPANVTPLGARCPMARRVAMLVTPRSLQRPPPTTQARVPDSRSPSAACRKRGGLRLRLCTGPGAELVPARLGGGAFVGGPVLRGHPAGSLESRRQVCCSGPGRAAHSGCPANCSRRTAEEDTHGPLAQALPCSHSTVAARSTPLVCLLRGSGSSAGSVCIPGTRALPVYSRCSINTLVAWTGVSSAHLWGFCGGWYRRGLEGNPATSHVHPSVLKAGGAGLSGCRAAREGMGAGLSLPASWSGRAGP